MKKKLSILLCMIACVLCFTGINSQAKENPSYDKKTLTSYTDMIINSFSQMSEKDFAQFTDGDDLQIKLTLLQNNIPADSENFIKMIEAWQGATKELGAYQGHGKYRFEEKNNRVVVATDVKFKDRNATIELVFDEDSKMDSLTINGDYSTGEILRKAGLNTILGMGTVFIVLIFISFLISFFKFIPDGSKPKKKEVLVSESEPVTESQPSAVVPESDDNELVAVITSAIAAATGTSSDGFIVRSIRRRTSNKWNKK